MDFLYRNMEKLSKFLINETKHTGMMSGECDGKLDCMITQLNKGKRTTKATGHAPFSPAPKNLPHHSNVFFSKSSTVQMINLYYMI